MPDTDPLEIAEIFMAKALDLYGWKDDWGNSVLEPTPADAVRIAQTMALVSIARSLRERTR